MPRFEHAAAFRLVAAAAHPADSRFAFLLSPLPPQLHFPVRPYSFAKEPSNAGPAISIHLIAYYGLRRICMSARRTLVHLAAKTDGSWRHLCSYGFAGGHARPPSAVRQL